MSTWRGRLSHPMMVYSMNDRERAAHADPAASHTRPEAHRSGPQTPGEQKKKKKKKPPPAPDFPSKGSPPTARQAVNPILGWIKGTFEQARASSKSRP